MCVCVCVCVCERERERETCEPVCLQSVLKFCLQGQAEQAGVEGKFVSIQYCAFIKSLERQEVDESE